MTIGATEERQSELKTEYDSIQNDIEKASMGSRKVISLLETTLV